MRPQRNSDPATSTTPIPRVDGKLDLSAQTLAWLAEHPQARKLVGSVWDTLTELERAGHHPRVINALRRILTHHQPTPAGNRAGAAGLLTFNRQQWHTFLHVINKGHFDQ